MGQLRESKTKGDDFMKSTQNFISTNVILRHFIGLYKSGDSDQIYNTLVDVLNLQVRIFPELFDNVKSCKRTGVSFDCLKYPKNYLNGGMNYETKKFGTSFKEQIELLLFLSDDTKSNKINFTNVFIHSNIINETVSCEYLTITYDIYNSETHKTLQTYDSYDITKDR
jgi:hypothetical protein